MSDISKEQVILPDELLDWIEEDKENATGEPQEKVRKVSGDTPVLQSRFENNVTSEQELALCSKGFIPKATASNTSWAVRNFQQWGKWRNSSREGAAVPDDLLEGRDAEALNKWLSLYIKETR